MLDMLSIACAGFVGGVVRAMLGIRKYCPGHGKAAAILSFGIIGALAGVALISFTALRADAALLAAGLAGYVGADVVETLYKIRIKRGGTFI